MKEAPAWKDILGEEAFEDRKNKLKAKEMDRRARLDALETELCRIGTELEECEKVLETNERQMRTACDI